MFLRKAWAFFERDLIETLSFKTQVLMDCVVIFAKCLAFFYLSKLVGPEALLNLLHTSTDYFSYVLAGIALTGFQTAAMESFAKAVYREQGAGTLEAILISPTSLETVVFSNLFWSSCFAMFRFLVYITVGIVFFGLDLSRMNGLSTAITLTFTLSSLSGLGMISAGLILLLKRPDPLGRTLNGLSQLLAGVYFPVSLLPSWIRPLGDFLPLTYALNAVRKSLFENAGPSSLTREWSILFLLTALLLPLGFIFFRYAVRKLRQEGLFASC